MPRRGPCWDWSWTGRGREHWRSQACSRGLERECGALAPRRRFRMLGLRTRPNLTRRAGEGPQSAVSVAAASQPQAHHLALSRHRSSRKGVENGQDGAVGQTCGPTGCRGLRDCRGLPARQDRPLRRAGESAQYGPAGTSQRTLRCQRRGPGQPMRSGRPVYASKERS